MKSKIAKSNIDKETTDQTVEQGAVQLQPSPGQMTSFPPIIYNFPTNNDIPILLGQMKEKLDNIEKRLESLEDKSNDIISRLERLESLFNVLENLPPPIGTTIKRVMDARVRR